MKKFALIIGCMACVLPTQSVLAEPVEITCPTNVADIKCEQILGSIYYSCTIKADDEAWESSNPLLPVRDFNNITSLRFSGLRGSVDNNVTGCLLQVGFKEGTPLRIPFQIPHTYKNCKPTTDLQTNSITCTKRVVEL